MLVKKRVIRVDMREDVYQKYRSMLEFVREKEYYMRDEEPREALCRYAIYALYYMNLLEMYDFVNKYLKDANEHMTFEQFLAMLLEKLSYPNMKNLAFEIARDYLMRVPKP